MPTVGGQTALNLSVELYEKGILDKFGVKLIGANVESIKVGEDRELFKAAMDEIGIESAKGGFAHSWDEAQKLVEEHRLSGDYSTRVSRSAERAAAWLLTRKNLKESLKADSPHRRFRRF